MGLCMYQRPNHKNIWGCCDYGAGAFSFTLGVWFMHFEAFITGADSFEGGLKPKSLLNRPMRISLKVCMHVSVGPISRSRTFGRRDVWAPALVQAKSLA